MILFKATIFIILIVKCNVVKINYNALILINFIRQHSNVVQVLKSKNIIHYSFNPFIILFFLNFVFSAMFGHLLSFEDHLFICYTSG